MGSTGAILVVPSTPLLAFASRLVIGLWQSIDKLANLALPSVTAERVYAEEVSSTADRLGVASPGVLPPALRDPSGESQGVVQMVARLAKMLRLNRAGQWDCSLPRIPVKQHGLLFRGSV